LTEVGGGDEKQEKNGRHGKREQGPPRPGNYINFIVLRNMNHFKIYLFIN